MMNLDTASSALVFSVLNVRVVATRCDFLPGVSGVPDPELVEEPEVFWRMMGFVGGGVIDRATAAAAI
jgi:hypothetical protein